MKNYCRAPFFEWAFRALPGQPAQPRLPWGARSKSAYCCFLPDLTGFTAVRRTGPEYHHRLSGAVPHKTHPQKGFWPPCSGFGVTRHR